ncbi:MAG TPA: 3'-5' exonuclease [Myxococcales bacterium]|nr:3'-5' exonuclease [Myxococcales bacterium]
MIEIDHAADRAAAAAWAQAALSDERAVILDTETTGLAGYVCDIAVVRAIDGSVLMDVLVNPGVLIEPGAQAVHGISDADVAGARSFADIYPLLFEVAYPARILVYNAEYDMGRLDAELARMDVPRRALGGFGWECIMLQYAAWVGEWNEFHGNYRWHKLDGEHRALGDCQAARRRLQQMAGAASA